jgi:hypothetical protein
MGDKATNLGGGRGFRPYFGRFAVNLAGDFARSAGNTKEMLVERCRLFAAHRHQFGEVFRSSSASENCLLHIHARTSSPGEPASAGGDGTCGPKTISAKKSSQKSTRPRGAKDVDTFPGAIGRNNACSQALCIEAVEGFRAYQPLRDRPSQASRPTTWDSSFRRKKTSGLRSTFAASLPACVLPTKLFIRCAGRIGPLQNTVKVGFKSL